MDTRLLKEIDGDLQLSPSKIVIYLEGKSDPSIFFALLGVPEPPDGIYRDVLVKGLSSKHGSGKSAVRERVETARSQGRGYQGVFGIVDGDGALLDEIRPEFDPPYVGPVFRWKSYCIESMLCKTGWPLQWGDIDWNSELKSYGPYVAVNRLHAIVQSDLAALGLARYSHPKQHATMQTAGDVEALLARARDTVFSKDISRLFTDQMNLFENQLEAGLEQALAMLNGKWLTEHFAVRKTGQNERDCLDQWLSFVRSEGGLDEVRELWRRITGRDA